MGPEDRPRVLLQEDDLKLMGWRTLQQKHPILRLVISGSIAVVSTSLVVLAALLVFGPGEPVTATISSVFN